MMPEWGPFQWSMPVWRGWSVRIHSRIEEEKCLLTLGRVADGLLMMAFLVTTTVHSASQELDRDRDELLVVLEDPAVAGVGKDDQLGPVDAAVQVL